MTLQASRPRLSQLVAAARSDVPDRAELERVFGPLLPAAARQSGFVEALPARTLTLPGRTKLVTTGSVLLVLAGAVFLSRSADRRSQHVRVPHAGTSAPAGLEARPEVTVLPAAPVPSALTPRPEQKASTHKVRTQRVRVAKSPSGRTQTPEPVVSSPQPIAASVEAESVLIEAARHALHADPARTLTLAAEHAERFGAGVLSLERDALTIHALVLLGRREEARGHFTALQRAAPGSIHVTRLRRVLDQPAARTQQ